MGKVSTKPQVGQDGQETGNLLLEITYGGTESPFGGIDSSASPSYIDPRCAVVMDHLFIVDNKLCAVSWQPLATPTLWSGVSGVKLIKFGTFYNSINGQLNYALGYKSATYLDTAVVYTFYMTSWNPQNIAQFWNDTIAVSFGNAITTAMAASITLPLLTGSLGNSIAGVGAAVNITALGVGASLTTAGTAITGGSGYIAGERILVTQGAAVPAVAIITSTDLIGAITGATIDASFAGSGFSIGAGAVSYPSGNTIGLAFDSLPGAPGISLSGGSDVPTTIALVVAAINADGAINPYVVAAPSADGLSLVLTAVTPGVIGNTITVRDASAALVSGLPYGFYFPVQTAQHFTGGLDAEPAQVSLTIENVTCTAVAGTVYFSNFGPLILKYSGPGLFQISSMYNGMQVLRKYGGSLIGLGAIPQLGVVEKDTDMIFAWSAALNLDEWSPLDSSGNVTGAGFAQLGDIEDYLSGLIVTNNTAYILRAKGLSYATAQSSGTNPFTFAHVALGHEGEGAQAANLICQYDQQGAFVGTSDVFQIGAQLSSIGMKIKTLLFSQLNNLGTFKNLSATAGVVYIGGDENVIAIFQLGDMFFVFNTANGTWSTLEITPSYPDGSGHNLVIQTSLLDTFASLNTLSGEDEYDQSLIVFGAQYQDDFTSVLQAPVFYQLQELSLADGITEHLNSQVPSIIFPQEELLFGRDVTIDALYISLWADVDTDTTLEFDFNGVLYSTFVLTSSQFNTMNGNPIELKIFPSNLLGGTGVFTSHSPQLTISIKPKSLAAVPAQVRFAKIQEYGSFDPNQRPV